jgi:hypothetical protein
MVRPSSSFPDALQGLVLHQRLLAQDPTATADLCAGYLLPLGECLCRLFPRVDAHFRQTAVHDALFNYARSPQAFKPEKSDLASYLRWSACGDLKNLLASEVRRQRRETSLENNVEIDELRGNYSQKDDQQQQPLLRLVREEEAVAQAEFLQEVHDELAPPDQAVLKLMLLGEDDTASCAEELGTQSLPLAEQQKVAKRSRDRIKKRIERRK